MGTQENRQTLNGERGAQALRFGPFELDLRSGELRRSGFLVHLQPQPSRVLELLALRPGELVTRDEIQRQLWPAGTFVDFEQSLNFCIRQIRSALGDSALSPRYLETLPKRGYRWIGPSESISGGPVPLGLTVTRAEPVESEGSFRPRPLAPPAAASGRLRWIAAGAMLVAFASLALASYLAFRPAPSPVPRFRRLTFSRGFVLSARFAPDGSVIYTASWEGHPTELFDATLETRDSRRLQFPGGRIVGVTGGGEVAFLNGYVLARARLAGGPAKEVLDDVVQADWLPDGSDFAVVREHSGRGRVEFPIGKVLCESVAPSHLRISPTRAGWLFWSTRRLLTTGAS
jgi:DNA-binding winged helix-turn-helix (wHTH) protein